MGSPPRRRGKDFSAQHPERGRGITPAWAGKSWLPPSPEPRYRDHPRVGGEKHIQETGAAWRWGSPPRGRGKAPLYPGSGSAPSDHPRVGGEKLYEQMEQGAGRGSPPRGRGKASFSGNSRPGVGITPAWAGKSHAVHSPSHGAGDHPRVGGEKWMTPKGEISYIGSPPRGRGKGLQRRKNTLLPGITPAWAGKRSGQPRTTAAP